MVITYKQSFYGVINTVNTLRGTTPPLHVVGLVIIGYLLRMHALDLVLADSEQGGKLQFQRYHFKQLSVVPVYFTSRPRFPTFTTPSHLSITFYWRLGCDAHHHPSAAPIYEYDG